METNIIMNGDVLEHLKELPDNSVDAIITDPPYGLEFMGKEWDSFTGSDTGIIAKPTSTYSEKGFDKLPIFRGFTKEQINQYQEFSYLWAKECLRVLKHGGYLLSFGGTRTYHRMTCGIEDAGFEIRDCIMWIYGTGFPKSLNIGKQIDKMQGNKREIVGQYIAPDGNPRGVDLGIQKGSFAKGEGNYIKEKITTKGNSEWEGWGTALKPACEPIVVARKPLSEKNIALNVLKWGTGGINIDECRIETNPEVDDMLRKVERKKRETETWEKGSGFKNENNNLTGVRPDGRFPTNIIFDEESNQILGKFNRFFYCAKASKSEKNLGCDYIIGKPIAWSNQAKAELKRGNASFSDNERKHNKIDILKNNHPTVKPIKLMEYLVKLVTKKNSIVLDPFLGSGTTAIACINLKRNWIGIEKEPDYIEIAKARIKHFSKQEKLHL